MVNIGSKTVLGKLIGTKEDKDKKGSDKARIELTSPACAQAGDKVALSRRIEKHWRLIGWGSIIKGKELDVDE